jgi:coenzyme F420-0:L-glutamate ligase/coenzyme F420-1:gamma-L-glutamate ligase
MSKPPKRIEVIPIQVPLVTRGIDVAKLIVESAKTLGITFEDEDIVAVADKVLAISDGRVADFTKIEPSAKARRLAEKYDLEPGFVELVLREAEAVYGGVPRALLTLKHGVFIANAGIDHKNVPKDYASLWPEDPNKTAKVLRATLQKLTGRRLGVLLVDSHVAPLRMGTIGFALGVAGFEPVKDCRGMLDLYGKPLLITRINIADSLAAVANLAMGETGERAPVAVIRGALVQVTDSYDPLSLRIAVENDLYSTVFNVARKGSA